MSLVAFILTENHHRVDPDTRKHRLVSSLSTESTTRHTPVSKIVIMIQSLVILSLFSWIVEEYQNNMYLRQYVSDFFQANGLIIGTVGVVILVGSVSGMMLVKRRHGGNRSGAVSLEVTSSTPKIKLAAEPSTKPPVTSATPSTDFHPVVAALKADMVNRRLSFGSGVSTMNDQPPMPPAPRPKVQRTPVLDQFSQNRQTPITGPPLQQMRAPFPQRPMLPLRPQESSGSSVLQTVQRPPPQIPANVSTVITGIMPVQKKKDPAATSEEEHAHE